MNNFEFKIVLENGEEIKNEFFFAEKSPVLNFFDAIEMFKNGSDFFTSKVPNDFNSVEQFIPNRSIIKIVKTPEGIINKPSYLNNVKIEREDEYILVLKAIAGMIGWKDIKNIRGCKSISHSYKLKSSAMKNGFSPPLYAGVNFYFNKIGYDVLSKFLTGAYNLKNANDLNFDKYYSDFIVNNGQMIERNYAKWLLQSIGLIQKSLIPSIKGGSKRGSFHSFFFDKRRIVGKEVAKGTILLEVVAPEDRTGDRKYNVKCLCKFCGNTFYKYYSAIRENYGCGCLTNKCFDLAIKENTSYNKAKNIVLERWDYSNQDIENKETNKSKNISDVKFENFCRRNKEFIGRKINNLKILDFVHMNDRKESHKKYNVKCECLKCNRIFYAKFSDIKSGHKKSCGCEINVKGLGILKFEKFKNKNYSFLNKNFGNTKVISFINPEDRNENDLDKNIICRCLNCGELFKRRLTEIKKITSRDKCTKLCTKGDYKYQIGDIRGLLEIVDNSESNYKYKCLMCNNESKSYSYINGNGFKIAACNHCAEKIVQMLSESNLDVYYNPYRLFDKAIKMWKNNSVFTFEEMLDIVLDSEKISEKIMAKVVNKQKKEKDYGKDQCK